MLTAGDDTSCQHVCEHADCILPVREPERIEKDMPTLFELLSTAGEVLLHMTSNFLACSELTRHLCRSHREGRVEDGIAVGNFTHCNRVLSSR